MQERFIIFTWNFFYFQGDDQLIERLAGLDGIITESGNNLKEESNKNRVRVLAEVRLKFGDIHEANRLNHNAQMRTNYSN